MKIKWRDVFRLFSVLGYPKARYLSDEEFHKAATGNKLVQLVREKTGDGKWTLTNKLTPGQQALYADIRQAVRLGIPVEITPGPGPVNYPAKRKKYSVPRTWKKPEPPRLTVYGPWQVKAIAEILLTGSKESPLTHADILAKLAERFPDDDPGDLQKTILKQVPGRLRLVQDIPVRSAGGGYWIDPPTKTMGHKTLAGKKGRK